MCWLRPVKALQPLYPSVFEPHVLFIHTLHNSYCAPYSVDGLDDSMFRKDACGALIMWDKFGKNNPFGWVIDHILPMSLGGDDNLLNLRALHYKNNLGKADDYPSYTASVKYDGRENVIDERNLTVNKKLREKLKQLYKNA